MKIENKSIVEKKTIEKHFVRFTREDIEKHFVRFTREDIQNMIIDRLDKEGIDTSGCTILFNAKFRNVEDEWEMNRTPRAEFVDIVVNL